MSFSFSFQTSVMEYCFVFFKTSFDINCCLVSLEGRGGVEEEDRNRDIIGKIF